MNNENNGESIKENALAKETELSEASKPSGSEQPPRGFAAAFEWIETFTLYFAIAMAVLLLLFTHSPVVGSSMSPTLENGDILIIRKLGYTAKNGDIIVCQSESYGMERPLVKRVIATEGQTVTIDYEKRKITVDGVVLNEDYIADSTLPFDSSDYLPDTFTVEDGKVFVMGDNRAPHKSLDSRFEQVGMIDERNVLGKVCVKILPLSEFKLY
ncbi:MAG: signal peptidase I [Clostridia bacterium]|nr:signal peptidase I [Clostridia bacterium]